MCVTTRRMDAPRGTFSISHGKYHKQIMAGVMSFNDLSGETLMEDYFRVHFHGDDPELDVWDLDPQVAEFIAVATATEAASLYVKFGVFANAILRKPSLLPPGQPIPIPTPIERAP